MVSLASGALPPAPKPAGSIPLPVWSNRDVDAEGKRLMQAINQPTRWGLEMCKIIAPLTLEINKLKVEKGVFLMAHSYQTPDIVYGVADAVGDSYGLAKLARDASQETILFSSVRFMAETAKILCPNKLVLHPSPEAGCSLSEGITADDVRKLKKENPGVPVACYVNTTAAVKAECDVCVTSSNYLQICEKLAGNKIIFVPDAFMGRHLQTALKGKKEVILWDATCEVHDKFTGSGITAWREEASREGKELQVLSHPECGTDVLAASDFVGSSEKMMDEAKRLVQAGKRDIMVITECGTADRLRAEVPGIELMGACVMCPHMKRTGLEDILRALTNPTPAQIIELDAEIIVGAKRSLDQMFALAE